MSNQSVISVAACIGVIIVIAIIDHLQKMRQIEKLKRGQREWKRIAERETSYGIWKHLEFERLIVHIWGAPPLNRNAKDVCKYIEELRDSIRENQRRETVLAAYSEELSKRLHEASARLESSGAELEARSKELAETASLVDVFSQRVNELTKENEVLRSRNFSDPLLQTTFKHLTAALVKCRDMFQENSEHFALHLEIERRDKSNAMVGMIDALIDAPKAMDGRGCRHYWVQTSTTGSMCTKCGATAPF